MHKISLEQWRMFIAVVDCGGFAQAGEQLYKTQSTLSHSIKKLEQTLGKALFDVVGRKAVLTSYGESLLAAARVLVAQADALEHDAISQKSQLATTLSLAVDTLFPRPLLHQILTELYCSYPTLNVQLYETTLSRCAELLEDGTVDAGIASVIPKGFVGRAVQHTELYAVAHQASPLHQQLNLPLQSLELQRQIVIRDAGQRSNTNSGWLGSQNRLTVSTLAEAIQACRSQLGFAWLPAWALQQPDNQDLRVLPLRHGLTRSVALQAVIRPSRLDDHLMKSLAELFSRYLNSAPAGPLLS